MAWCSEGLMLTGRRRSWSLMLMVVGVVGLAGCSSGGDTTAAPTTSTSATSVPAASGAQGPSAADVAAGLRRIDQAAKDTAQATGTDKARAVSLDGLIEPTWKTIEDGVKAKDPDAYVALEDSFAALEDAADKGDAAKATKSSAEISTAVQAYLAKYSG
jgi:hypothetical protein